jgi:hypothetical protein
VIENGNIELAIGQAMELVLDSLATLSLQSDAARR